MLLNKLKAEFIGCLVITLFFTYSAVNVLIGAHSVMALAIQLFFMFAVLTWMTKSISLAQLNPNISFSLLLSDHLTIEECLYNMMF